MSVAMVGAGIAAVGVVSNAYSANKATKAQTAAANKANDTALQAQRESIAYQQAQAAQARADNEPWRAAGVTALNKLAGMPDFTGAGLQNEPGYQFALNEGMKGVTNSAAARGGLLSGAALKAASQYNNDYASAKFNDAFSRDATNKNRLASIAGIGQTAAGQNASASNALGSSIGNTLTNTAFGVAQNQLAAGNARASGYVANGNALTNGLSQGLNWYNQNSLLNGSRSSGVTEGATNQTDNFNYYGTGYSP